MSYKFLSTILGIDANFTGNLGVGTTTPTNKLDVIGTSYFSTDMYVGQNHGIFFNGNGGYAMGLFSSGSDLLFQGGSVERMRLTSAGQLSIGTTANYGAKLQVYSDSNIQTFVSPNASAYVSFVANNSTTYGYLGTSYSLIGSGIDFSIRSENNLLFATGGATERMRITASGNVGIGTNNPTNKLQIGVSESTDQLLRLSIAYDTSRSLKGGINWNDTSNTTGQISTEYDGSMVSMVFGSLYNSGYNTNRLMVIRGNGNVGIGTTNPNAKLSAYTYTGANLEVIHSNGGTFPKVSAIGIGSDAVGVTYTTSGSTLYTVGSAQIAALQSASSNATTDMAFYTTSGGSVTEKMRIDSDGRVGIGTTSPSYKLDINGAIRIQGNTGIYFDTTGGTANNYVGITNDYWTTLTCGRGYTSAIDLTNGNGILFRTNYSERMRIEISGNVLIGTTTDAGYNLQVNGSIYNNNLVFPLVAYSSSNSPRITNPMSVKLYDNYFNGIAGSDYGTVLDIYGRVGHVDTQIYMDASQTLYFRIAAYASGWGSWKTIIDSSNISSYAVTGSGTTNYLPIFTGSTSIGNSAVYQNNGNIAIGTTTAPGSANWKGTAVFGNDGENKVIVGQLRNTVITGAVIGGHNSTISAWADLNIMGGDVAIGSAQNIYLSVKTSGNVLIGTTTDTGAKLQVVGGAISLNQSGQNILFANNVASGTSGYNIFIGNGGVSITGSGGEGSYNASLGYDALRYTTTGSNNTAVGAQSMRDNSTGYNNAAFGMNSLVSNSSGYFNVAVGKDALFYNTSGYQNTAIGASAMFSNTTGLQNTAVGRNALINNTTGNYSVAVGVNSLLYNNGDDNVALGSASMYSNTSGRYNLAAGSIALYNNTTGDSNVALGFASLYTNTTGTQNTAVGRNALNANTTASYNTAVGFQSLNSNTTGEQNTAVGRNSLLLNTTGSYNSSFGLSALFYNSTGSFNTGLGFNALFNNTTANNNTGIGAYSLFSNTTGANNTSVGFYSMQNNSTGNYNTALGYQSLQSANNDRNTSIGYLALGALTSGSLNTAVGMYSGYNDNPGSGYLTTNTNSVFLGYQSKSSANGNTNEIVIGYDADGQGSNSAVLGNGSISKTVLRGNVLIGTTTDTGYKLNVDGTGIFTSGVTSTGLIVNGTEFYYAPANYTSGGFSRLLGRNSSTGRIEGMSAADVQAFIGLSGYISGSGTTNYLPKFTGSTSVGNSSIYDNGGNIGIGLTNADYPLTVGSINVGGAGANLGIILNSVINSAIPSSSIKAVIGVANSGYGYAAGSLLLQPRTGVGAVTAFATEGVERMRIDSGGNVGIGTTNPIYKLVVSNNGAEGMEFDAGTISSDINYLINYNRSTSSYVRFELSASLTILGGQGNVLIGISTNSGYKLDVNGSSAFRNDMYIYGNYSTYWYNGTSYFQATNSSNVGTLKMTDNSSPISLQPNGGNVGIGTTNPTNTLTVVSPDYTTVRSQNNWSTNYFTLSNFSGTNSASIFSVYNDLGFATSNSAIERMRLTNAGNLLINTTTDLGFKLNVNGAANISSSLYLNSVEFAASDGTNNYIKTGATLYYQAGSTVIATLSNAGVFTLSNLSGSGTRMVVADSSGTLSTQAIPSPTTKSFGAFQENTTQTAASSNTGYGVKFTTPDISGHGIDVVADPFGDRTYILMSNGGFYNIQFSLQLQNTSGQIEDVTIWLRKNGNNTPDDIPATAGFVSVPNSHGGTPGTIIAAWNYFVEAAPGDFYQLVWSTTDHTRVSIEYYPAGSPPPSAASAILTVNQVD